MCVSETHNLRLFVSACGLLVVVPGVVHTFLGVISSVHKSVDGSLYPRRISLSLKETLHLLSLNVTVHPALHNTLIPKSDAIAKFGTICPINVVGSPGMLMLHICIDLTCLPSRRLIVNGFVAGSLFSTSTPSMRNMDVAPVSAMACKLLMKVHLGTAALAGQTFILLIWKVTLAVCLFPFDI